MTISDRGNSTARVEEREIESFSLISKCFKRFCRRVCIKLEYLKYGIRKLVWNIDRYSKSTEL